MKKTTKKRNKFLIAMIIIIAILGIIAISVFAFAKIYINNKTSKIQYEELNILPEELGISENQKESKFRNIAILGVDSRYNDYDDFARTDCIMIASINTENNNVSLFSIYRDTLVEMDLYDKVRIDKINHSYYGGVETTLKTINVNFDLNVKEYILIDFEAVADFVNQVGGIEIDITNEELKLINNNIKGNIKLTGINSKLLNYAGKQTLDGIQALSYARIRYTEGGDYKRADRMRNVLERTAEKIKQKNIVELNNIANNIMPKIRTNISEKEISKLLENAIYYKIIRKFGFPYNTISTVLDLKDYYEGTTKGSDYYDVPQKFVEDVEKLHREVLEEEDYVATEKIKEIELKIKEAEKMK